MATLDYFLIAESASIDRETNGVSVFSIIEDVSGTLPVQLARLVAVSAWSIAPEDYQKDFQVTLRIPQPWKDTEPKHFDFCVNFTAERPRQRILQHVVSLPFHEPGELKFDLLLNGERVAQRTITVHRGEPDVASPVEDSEGLGPP